MPWNQSNELLKKYLEDVDRRFPCKPSQLRPCPYGFNHKSVLSMGLNQRETIGRRYEICCRPEKGDPRCFMHGKLSRAQPSCEALADMFAYIASLDVAPWEDEAFIDFACASTIAFNHRAVQARVDPPGALQKHWLASQRAFPPYVDLPAYRVAAAFPEPPLMVTPVTFAGMLSKPFPRKTGLLPPCDHCVKVCVALYQINNFQASLLDCVGIKRGEIVEFTLRQTGIFKELGIQDTDRHVLASLEIYLPAQAKWSRAPRPSDKLHLAVGEGVIYRLPHVKRTPDLANIIKDIIPPALLGVRASLPALSAHGPQVPQANALAPCAPAPASVSVLARSPSTLASPVTANTSASAILPTTSHPAQRLTCSSFTIRKNGRLQRASSQSPISAAHRGVRRSTAVCKTTTAKASTAIAALSDNVIEIEDDVVKGSAQFWQRHLKTRESNPCLVAEGTHANPIDLMDVDSDVEDAFAL